MSKRVLEEILKSKDYPSFLLMNDGSEVDFDNWNTRRQEMLDLLEKYSYGRTPKEDVSVCGNSKGFGPYTCAGKCTEELIEVIYKTKHGEGVIPIQLFTPTMVCNPPVILHIAFRNAPDRYIPVEEIIDRKYALVIVNYQGMVNDNCHGDYSDGIAAHFGTSINRKCDEWGKIGMWAWGASRVLDYLIQEKKNLKTKQTAIIGHSRLGKTALWCGAQDERFAAVISNNSGYGGAASSKHGEGERVVDFLNLGSWDWFCENFKNYKGELEDYKPYDQSFLLALIAPRYLLVGSAELDDGADPKSEFLTTLHASAAWEKCGVVGLVTEDRMPVPGDYFGGGNILYHYRSGMHYLSRTDWLAYLKFLDAKFDVK